jgi:hypothetical protein
MASIGSTSDAGFPVPSIGLGLDEFKSFVYGQHTFCQTFAKANSPKVILSASLFNKGVNSELNSLIETFMAASQCSNALNVINLNASSVGSLDYGCFTANKPATPFNVLILVGIDPKEDLSSDSLE